MSSGGNGSDSYILERNSGRVTISDPYGSRNTVTFDGYNSSSNFTFGLGSLVVSSPDGDELHLMNFDPNDVYGFSAIETFKFNDGVELSYADFVSQGFDIYVFNMGDGVDTIEDTSLPGEGNIIRFGSGIAQSDLTIVQDTASLSIAVGRRHGQ